MADSLRLSPVFERVQSDPLRNMEGLNPERALRLLQPRSPEMPTNISVGPRMSGSNALSLGVATSQKQSGVKKELSPSQNGRGAQPLVHLPKNPTLVIAGVKRPRDHLDNSESYAQKHPCSNPPSFPPPPPTNIHTIYLESLITPRCLLLTIKSRRGDGSQAILTQYRSISNAGLLLVNAIQARLDLPVLQLPAPNEVEGSLERVIQGDLLETVWCDITPEAKYAYARQLRHILNNMRSGMNPIHADSTTSGTRSMLGSAMSGPFSLMLDQHVQNTYWAVRVEPTCRQFVAFLASSFVQSVPTQVTDALKCQFRSDYNIRFTHGELSPKNIIVQNSKIVCILGWDSGGWYPEWWEYVKFFEARTAPENQDWYDYARDIFVETFPNELVAYQGIARCQRQ
ncbi:uncharacterized protein TRIVIDRAFT_68424 [Trichoderma virens Gv29-8]|uniref:Aminoglycoside phosphotransferase domain-containing protein n=1 Tax=Hypocrea virens (strain Gv29-8 / FGSC 10586) TaxID=413071 RepID=G9N474_HYPVG|nr:uncharacterized protein TRIVIDRAFT_68424 [Trichoderma virens Gv29-8]EHK18400.1 hypothetical protein TRIVIDRAFT_68424 [Trichoderma virens Gv29-8]